MFSQRSSFEHENNLSILAHENLSEIWHPYEIVS
jgi:hypothetical protein